MPDSNGPVAGSAPPSARGTKSGFLSFWTTLPGIFTGLAAFFGALTGLLQWMSQRSSTPPPAISAESRIGGEAPPLPVKPPPVGCGSLSGRSAFEAANECYKAYKRGDISAAETFCNEGLVKAKCTQNMNVQGAIYFSLGLCAETRADWRDAKSMYESSLKVRPDNSSTEERLNTVSLRLQQASSN